MSIDADKGEIDATVSEILRATLCHTAQIW